MTRLVQIGFAACVFTALASFSASAMPSAHPSTLSDTDGTVIMVRGGHGHMHMMGHGGRGHHHGWGRGHRHMHMHRH
jgi:hypothetical protein